PHVDRPAAAGQLVAADVGVGLQPAPGRHVVVGGGVVGEHRHHRAQRHLVDLLGEHDDGDRALAAERVDGQRGRGRLPVGPGLRTLHDITPASSRIRRTSGGRTSRNRSTSSAEAPRGSDTRTFPWVSTPIASKTCDGRSVLAVQELPDEIAKPALSSSVSNASPATYRQENVTMCGTRSTGSPTTSTS